LSSYQVWILQCDGCHTSRDRFYETLTEARAEASKEGWRTEGRPKRDTCGDCTKRKLEESTIMRAGIASSMRLARQASRDGVGASLAITGRKL